MTDGPQDEDVDSCAERPGEAGAGGDNAAADLRPSRCGITARELPALPDAAFGADPTAGWLDLSAWFERKDAPLEIEIGSGKGTFLVQEAELKPEVNYLGIEWAGEFFRHAADRVDRHGLTNVRVLYADATEFLRYRVATGSVRTIHLYFSDPWPKKRHHKNRVVQDRFLIDAWRVLAPGSLDKPGGELRIVTDHEDYWGWMEEHFARFTAGEPVKAGEKPAAGRRAYDRSDFEPVESAGAQELVGSNFERKYRREGRPFHGTVLRKVVGV